MNGPEHYAESEHLISALPSCQCPASPCVHEQIQIARAQVHATLAVAAAVALTGYAPDGTCYDMDIDAWYQAAGTRPAEVTR